MNQILITLILFLCCSCASQKSQLIGKWKSDHDLSMDYIEKNVKMRQKPLRFLDSLTGHLTINFSERRKTFDLPDLTVLVNGKETTFQGARYITTYKILFQTEKQIVITSINQFTKKSEATIFYFDSPDLMWVYLGGADDSIPDLHAREYFRRVN
jgi:hypothetical protein